MRSSLWRSGVLAKAIVSWFYQYAFWAWGLWGSWDLGMLAKEQSLLAWGWRCIGPDLELDTQGKTLKMVRQMSMVLN